MKLTRGEGCTKVNKLLTKYRTMDCTMDAANGRGPERERETEREREYVVNVSS